MIAEFFRLLCHSTIIVSRGSEADPEGVMDTEFHFSYPP